MKTLIATGCVSVAVVVGGCGGAAQTRSTSSAAIATAGADPQASLTAAVRETLRANHRLARLALWRNVVPTSATRSTRGPALAALRSSAAGRRRRGIHVKVLSDGFKIVSISLDPSLTRANAVVFDPQRVRPYGSNGKALGHGISLSEKSRFELHRLGTSKRFVVWRVAPLQ